MMWGGALFGQTENLLCEERESSLLERLAYLNDPLHFAVSPRQLFIARTIGVHPISTEVLGQIARLIRFAEDFTKRHRRVTETDKTDARTHTECVALPDERKLRDRLTDCLCDQESLIRGAVFQQDTELIAAKWAEARGVTQVAFKPDWTKHAKAAPFKRNDAMLDVLPVGVLVFPGNGIQENLADKAKKLGIPVMKFEKGA